MMKKQSVVTVRCQNVEPLVAAISKLFGHLEDHLRISSVWYKNIQKYYVIENIIYIYIPGPSEGCFLSLGI